VSVIGLAVLEKEIYWKISKAMVEDINLLSNFDKRPLIILKNGSIL
jgi:hypothetical protein